MVPQKVAFAFNTAPVAGADIFETNIQPNTPNSTGVGYKDTIFIGCDSTAPVVSVEFDITIGANSATDKTYSLNGGAALAAGAAYAFDIPMIDGISYNVSLSISATVTAWIVRSYNSDL